MSGADVRLILKSVDVLAVFKTAGENKIYKESKGKRTAIIQKSNEVNVVFFDLVEKRVVLIDDYPSNRW